MEMEVKGVVKEILKNNIAKVMIERKSACGGNCHDCLNTCQGKSEIFVRFSEKLQIGDEVIISERSQKVLSVSIIVFMLPLLFIVALYMVLDKYINNEEIVSLISFSGGVAIFLAVILYFRKLKMPFCKKINA